MTVPDVATGKLLQLTQQAADAMALARSAKDRASTLEAKVTQLGNARASEAEVAKAAAQHEQAQTLMMARYRAYEQREQLASRCRSWLDSLPRGTTLEPAPRPLITANGAPATAVASLRAEIGKLAASHHSVRTANAPPDDAKRQVRELVASLAARGRPALTTQFGTLVVHGWAPDQQFGPTVHARVIEFAAWLDPEQMISKLDEAIASQSLSADRDLPEPLPIAERAARLAEIEDEIMILECREEHLIMQAQADGIVIERRFDQSPASILGVRVSAATTARAA